MMNGAVLCGFRLGHAVRPSKPSRGGDLRPRFRPIGRFVRARWVTPGGRTGSAIYYSDLITLAVCDLPIQGVLIKTRGMQFQATKREIKILH